MYRVALNLTVVYNPKTDVFILRQPKEYQNKIVGKTIGVSNMNVENASDSFLRLYTRKMLDHYG